MLIHQLIGVARTICSVLTELTGGWNKSQIKERHLPCFERYVELGLLSSPISITDDIMPLWTPSLFDRETFAWVGGSLFASLRGNTSRYILREEFQSFHTKNTTKSNEENNNSAISSTPSRIPDWMSLDPIDWRFYGTLGIHSAPVQTVKPTSFKSTKVTSSSSSSTSANIIKSKSSTSSPVTK